MRCLSLDLLAACTPARPVAMWTVARPGSEERVEVRDNGDIIYVATNNGVEEKPETLKMSQDQVSELGDVLRHHQACQLAHEPGYTPDADEGQTTLVLSFPDQRCKVTLWNSEW